MYSFFRLKMLSEVLASLKAYSEDSTGPAASSMTARRKYSLLLSTLNEAWSGNDDVGEDKTIVEGWPSNGLMRIVIMLSELASKRTA